MGRFNHLLSFVAIVLCTSASLSAQSGTWHTESQLAREQQLVARGLNNLGQNMGQCWYYVSTTLQNASTSYGANPVCTLPLATDDGFGSLNGYHFNMNATNAWVSLGCIRDNTYGYTELIDGPNMRPGLIVQMRIHYANGTYGPHTAIVYKFDRAAGKITWLESNYSADGIVRTREQLVSDFYNSVQGGYMYSIYYPR